MVFGIQNLQLYMTLMHLLVNNASVDIYTGEMGAYITIFTANEKALEGALQIVSLEILDGKYRVQIIHEKMKKIIFYSK